MRPALRPLPSGHRFDTVLLMVLQTEGFGPETGLRLDNQSGECTKGTSLENPVIFNTTEKTAGGLRQVANGTPGDWDIPEDGFQNLCQLPDAEKPGPVVDGGDKHTFYTPLNAF